MKRYLSLALFAFVFLASAAVWTGNLNQDEGWGLYAALSVARGEVPYRDFFYTQGPVAAYFYAAFSPLWEPFGVAGARILTALVGALATALAALFAFRLVRGGTHGRVAALCVAFLLGSNLYHVYYTAIPKTYALVALFYATGFCFLSIAFSRASRLALAFAAASFALAAGTRFSFALAPAAVFVSLLVLDIRRTGFGRHLVFSRAVFFAAVSGAVLLAVYGPFLADGVSRAGLFKALGYHAAREGAFDPVFTVGSLSRLVRWYLPVFVFFGLGFSEKGVFRSGAAATAEFRIAFLTTTAVFAAQLLAPHPYEDYQTPLMAVAAALAAAACAGRGKAVLLALGLSWAVSFGSPLLEEWHIEGKDLFWTLKKDKCDMARLKEAAALVEAADPGGSDLLTQDLYLAVEAHRRVPAGLEMGPFSIMSHDEWIKLLSSAPCRIAALSDYSFAIDPPSCRRRPFEEQMEFWRILGERYSPLVRIDRFGQNCTTLRLLERNNREKAP